MREFSDRIEEIDQILQDDPVKGFQLAVSLLERPPAAPCDRARALDSFATACRVFGDLQRAEDAYGQANVLCRCERCWWDRLRRLTYLRVEQGEPQIAQKFAESALAAAPNRAMSGRCRIAVAYARFALSEDAAAIEIARQGLEELAQSDLLYTIGALTTIGFCANRIGRNRSPAHE